MSQTASFTAIATGKDYGCEEVGSKEKGWETVKRQIEEGLEQFGLSLDAFEALPDTLDGWKSLALIAPGWNREPYINVAELKKGWARIDPDWDREPYTEDLPDLLR